MVVLNNKKIIKKVISKLNHSKLSSSELDAKAKNISGFLNCRLFVQTLTGISDIEKQPLVNKPKIGDILWWGQEHYKTKQLNYRHVAVYAGNGYVWQVEEWGKLPEKLPLKEVIKYWEKPDKIFKGKNF